MAEVFFTYIPVYRYNEKRINSIYGCANIRVRCLLTLREYSQLVFLFIVRISFGLDLMSDPSYYHRCTGSWH